MSGYAHTALDTIEDLRRNLRDRYRDCHAVLKELLQNADDAGATELHIAWLKGLPEANHPLLHGPLLVIMNNGAFTFRDSLAIHLAGTGSKGHEDGRIGKFGLGLKSVFHLCETFFYFSDPSGDAELVNEEIKKYPRTGILNPWSGERYSVWNEFTLADQGRLQSLATSLFGKNAKDWFGICLPLRKKQHCMESDGDDPAEWAIEPQYYGENDQVWEDIFSDRRTSNVQQMMPLMSTLGKVIFWRELSIDKISLPTVKIVRISQTHMDWRTMSVGRRAIAGIVNLIGSNGENRQTFAGIHELLNRKELVELAKDSKWPYIDSQTNEGRRRKPAAAKQHVGVVIMELREKGILRVDRAVFLPLGDPPHPECQSNSKYGFEITLHGYFFVDAGRLGVDFPPEQEQPTVRQKWNQKLYLEGTLPLIIPAMVEYARSIEAQSNSNEKLQDLTDLFYGSQLWRKHCHDICRSSSWVFRLDQDGGGWCSVRGDLPFILLPGNEQTDPLLPFEVFPSLAEHSGELVLLFSRQRRLKLRGNDPWPNGLQHKMLMNVPLEDVVKDEAKLDYLCQTCQELCAQDTVDYLPDLVELMRRILRRIPLSELRRRKRKVCSLLSILPTEATLGIPFKTDLVRESERIFKNLVDQDTGILPIPNLFMDGECSASKSVETDDLKALLHSISMLRPTGAQKDAFYSLVGQVLVAILQSWTLGPASFLDEFGDLPLFYIREYKSGKRMPFSGNELYQLRNKGMVFAKSAILCKKLDACLENSRILFIAQSEVAVFLSSAIGDIPAGDPTGCAELLSKGVDLVADVSPRADLLRAMLPALSNEDAPSLIKAMRYLLHHQQDNIHIKATLYVDGDSPWCQLARSILDCAEKSWRLIPVQLAKDLSPSNTDRLDLRHCNANSIPALFDELVGCTLDCTEFASHTDWVDQIIREWPENRIEGLKRLPIFVCADGSATSITEQTFIQGDLPRPPFSVFPDLAIVTDETGAIRRRELAPTLAPEGVLRKVLSFPDCHEYWQFILESIPLKIPPSLKKELHNSCWLPISEDSGCAPSDVICRDSLVESVRRLREHGKRLIHKVDLPHCLTSHGKWGTVESLCPKGESLYRRLGVAVKGVPDFATGEHTVQEDTVAGFIDLFGIENGDEVMPAAHLFQQLRGEGKGYIGRVVQHLLPETSQSLTVARSIEVLNFIANRHEASGSTARTGMLHFFNSFLREATQNQSFFDEILPNIRLLNQENHWCAPSVLCVSSNNVAPCHLLHPEHLSVLSGLNSLRTRLCDGESNSGSGLIVGHSFDPKELADSPGILREYLDSWRGEDVPDDALGAIVAMLGNNDRYPELYEHLRDSHPIESMRKLFSWDDMAGPGWWKYQELMDKQHFCIIPADADSVNAVNLLGRSFEAAVSTDLESLFDGFNGKEYSSRPRGDRCIMIRLRRINPETLQTDRKLEILGNTLRAIRSLIHRQSDEGFEEVWRKITHVGQLDIQTAQQLILESSAMLLETQLSIKNDESLKDIFKKWHQVRQWRQSAATSEERQNADNAREKVLDSLRTLLLKDQKTQNLIIKEICKRLEAASYEASSIPFELFQNADDAVVELESLCDDEDILKRTRPSELRRRFTVEVIESGEQIVLRFIHWGRGINQFRIGTNNGKDQGFDRDMERMLVLQGSGKDDSDRSDSRTGKFGLGFKSVFFVCDSPRVLSGSRSRFRVLGGVYPHRLASDDEKRLEKVLDAQGDPRHKGTIIELPLRDRSKKNDVLKQFRCLAGYLVVFARCVRQCNVEQPNEPSFSCKWDPEAIAPNIEIGEMNSADGCANRVLVFRLGTDEYSTILLHVGAHGICSSSLTKVPEVWVTTPTAHTGYGYILVNGNFDLNPGRTQLRKTDQNEQLARKMGLDLGRHLCRLHDLGYDNWIELRAKIGCDNATWDEFWTSLWEACAPYAGKESHGNVLNTILFGSEHGGILRLITEMDALPSGLPNEYSCLTSVPSIRWRTSGILTSEKVWNSAKRCQWIRENIEPGCIVSSSVGSVLDKICDNDINDLTLTVVVERTLDDDPFITPVVACDLGTFIFPERLGKMTNDRTLKAEEEAMRETLAPVKFQTEAGEWRAPSDLLILQETVGRKEEYRRASFAPPEHLLYREYKDDAIKFFLACRKEMKVSAEQLATWVIQANDTSRRRAALEYLDGGELSSAIQGWLKDRSREVEGSWLNDPQMLEKVMPDDVNRKAVILGRLNKGDDLIQSVEVPPTCIYEVPQSTRSETEILKDILSWWQRDRQSILANHDRRVFPDGKRPILKFGATEDELKRDLTVRREWMMLFMRGSMQRLGRVTDHQHRGFLELCLEEGWLDTLASSSEDPSKWFDLMDDFLDRKQSGLQYYQWMNQFLAYYQLSRWLPSYVRVFDAVTRLGVDLENLRSIGDIANLRTSHIFAGSTGFDAPPCSRTLGLGSHFILRETIRTRFAESSGDYTIAPQLAKVAFVPSLTVRKLVASITANQQMVNDANLKTIMSSTIADLMCKHLGSNGNFDGCFDIPLLALTWPKYKSVRAKILGSDCGWSDDDQPDFLAESTDLEEREE